MPDAKTIREALQGFRGTLLQYPPMASALKRDGVRLYDLHRRGLTIERDPRPITVHSITLLNTNTTDSTATFEISCSSGTYVRSLISDLAYHLHSGAYLASLRRTSVGDLSLRDATIPPNLTPETLHNRIIPPQEVVRHLPVVEVMERRWVCNGGKIGAVGEEVFRVEMGGELLAIYREEGEEARPEVVMCGG
jgi:tRNA pseudouridine55 synthase